MRLKDALWPTRCRLPFVPRPMRSCITPRIALQYPAGPPKEYPLGPERHLVRRSDLSGVGAQADIARTSRMWRDPLRHGAQGTAGHPDMAPICYFGPRVAPSKLDGRWSIVVATRRRARVELAGCDGSTWAPDGSKGVWEKIGALDQLDEPNP
jgi:hypothetical protein